VPKVLLMESDARLARRLADRIAQERIAADVAGNGREGLDKLADGQYDLAVAADNLPDMNGERVLHELCGKPGVPVMLLAVSNDARNRIRYYRLGANDVLAKPPVLEEFVARVWNLLRLAGKADNIPIRVDDLVIDPTARKAEIAGECLPLTPTEFDLLLYFAKNEGKPLSREQIMENVWGYTFSGRTNLVDVYVRYLRLKIDKKYRKKLFHTVRGFGYRFDAGREG